MKILILGAGAIGAYYGARLLEAGANVTFLVRPARAARLANGGLSIESPLGNFERPVNTVSQDQLTAAYDLVLLACKTYDLDSAVAAIAPAVGPHTGILPLLNGMATYDALDRRFGRDCVLGGVAYIATSLKPSGAIVHFGSNDTLLVGARSENQQPLTQRFFEYAAKSPGVRKLSTQIDQDLWEKWVMIAAGAAITCLMRGTIGDIINTQHGRALIEQAMAECSRAATGCGHAPRPAAVQLMQKLLLDAGSSWAASMMRDIEQDLPRLEVGHIIGDLLRRAHELGMDLPLMRTAHAHLQVYEVRHRQTANSPAA